MKKIYSTPQAAKKIGVSFITLHRWFRDGKIRPQGIPVEGRTLWYWNDADIAHKERKKSQFRTILVLPTSNRESRFCERGKGRSCGTNRRASR